jgi:two-component system, NtrC family, response regulator AtoC
MALGGESPKNEQRFVTTLQKTEIAPEPPQGGFVAGVSPAMQALENVISEIAPTNIPVLFVGESGTGKEMFAHRLHRLSGKEHKTLVKISCATMSPSNFSAGLGLSAHGNAEPMNGDFGTVLFDEISELDAACQRNLLSMLPDGEGAPSRGQLNARIVSTTTRNLDEEMCAGRFRSELFYRINGMCLRLPPLRERKEDIPLLTEVFLTKQATKLGRKRPSISERTLNRFVEYSWPGNIRELENAVKKLVALGDEQRVIDELSFESPAARAIENGSNHSHSLKAAARAASREAERELILEALNRTRWNRKKAAQELQISYKSLLYKLKQIGFADQKVNS